jgi:hypothetical protein
VKQSLRLHPDSRCDALERIDVQVTRPRPGHLALRYIVSGTISGLRLPPVAVPARTDELWKHTCFEAFIRTPTAVAYNELNLSPSTQWAAYRFAGYRDGMNDAREIDPPRIEVKSNETRLELHATAALDRLPGLPPDAAWTVALSAVIEEMNGNKSYWALAHPQGQPDFHHPDCFALELAAA